MTTASERLLRELIALPSVNPAFLAEGHPLAGEHRVADYLAASAATAGLDVEFQAVEGRANLLISLIPPRATRRIVLAPHMDTVGLDADADLLKPVRRGDRLYGRGACDTKGSIAAMFTALVAVARSGRRPVETAVVLAALVDEEHAQAGSRALAARGFQADLAIVGEPTEAKVVTAHKGAVWMNLRTRGRAAHGSKPECGVNAIREMARVVEFVEGDYRAMLLRRKHPLLGWPTVNVGVIVGGRQANIVPDDCCIRIDRRLVPGETAASAMTELRQMLAKRGLKAQLTSLRPDLDCLPMETDASLPAVREFMRATGQRQARGVRYFSDASILAHAGIPSVLFGPGNIAQAHTFDEWVSLRSLETATSKLTRYLSTLP